MKIKKCIIKWVKKITYNNADLVNEKSSPHCPNYATRCCLTCNRCWKGKN
ncbi:hypothetical protein [Clostridium sp. C2-6-12]|nr:hypothetical protein [Clostridium sp. C2-6-12]